MAESTTKTPSDDVVREILLRLDDVAALFRCATTCKHWRRLVTEPYFLRRRQWPPSLVGFFTKRCVLGTGTGTSPADSSRQLTFVPLPGSSLLGTRPRALSSIIHADGAAAAAIVDGAVQLATRGGLLLVRLYLHDGDRKRGTVSLAPVCNPIVGLAVCNTLAGTWDVLPELNCQSKFHYSDEWGCEIVPRIARDGSTTFKVLMVGKDKDKSQYNLHTFVSGEASWRAPTKCFDMMENRTWAMQNREAVVCRGYAHWLFFSESNHFHVLAVDVETGHVSLTKLLSPKKHGFCRTNMDGYEYDLGTAMANMRDLSGANRLVTTSDGTSLSLCAYRGRRLEIWTQQHQEEEWHLAREIDHELTEQIQRLERPFCIWSGEWSGKLLITEHYGRKSCLYIARLDTGTLEEATELFPDHARRGGIMPMEVDWRTFFVLRLGGSPA